MFLALDVGNSHITLGLHDGQAWRAVQRWATWVQATPDEYGLRLLHWLHFLHLTPQEVTAAGMVSVVPALTSILHQALEAYLQVETFVCQRTEAFWTLTRLKIAYRKDQVGLDRIVNAVAALMRYGGYQPLGIVDIGTAVTVDVVRPNGEFLGGAIAPGPGTMLEALHLHTALLPRLSLEAPAASPIFPQAQSTQEALRLGVLASLAGMLQWLVARWQEHLGQKPRVVATGGWSLALGSWLRTSGLVDVVDEYLTLEGVRILWQRARAGG